MFKNFGKIDKGTTLIELLVTIAVFSIVITTSVELLASALRYQRAILDEAYLLNTTSFVIEYMSRALRMAQKDIAGVCIAPKYNFATSTLSNIKFLNYKQECQEFFLEGDILKVKKGTVTQPLTPSNLAVENLKFETRGATQNDTLQPKVTFSLKMRTKASLPHQLFLQSSVSQRMLDVPY